MFVKIDSCSDPNLWYYKLIGMTVEVKDVGRAYEYELTGVFENGFTQIKSEDCRIVFDPELGNSKIKSLSIKDLWIDYDFIESRPAKPDKYLVKRKDGKIHFETWNGSGWAYNEKSIKYFQPIMAK